jgi:ribose 5-phosphate isomerase B
MRIALASDEPYAVHRVVRAELEARGHQVVPFGSVVDGQEHPWASVAEAAAIAVRDRTCDEGIFFCWTGTGISIAANKVAGVRAALCADAATAAAARTWNHANVLCLSNRATSDDVAKEILAAWFDARGKDDRGAAGVATLAEVDGRHRRSS